MSAGRDNVYLPVTKGWTPWALTSSILLLSITSFVFAARDKDEITARGVVAFVLFALPIVLVHALALGTVAAFAGRLVGRKVPRSKKDLPFLPFCVSVASACAAATLLYLCVLTIWLNEVWIVVPSVSVGASAFLVAALFAIKHR